MVAETNPIMRATALGLTMARELARRGLAIVDPEVSRKLSENGLENGVSHNGETRDAEAPEHDALVELDRIFDAPPSPDPEPIEDAPVIDESSVPDQAAIPDQAAVLHELRRRERHRETQLAVAEALAGAASADEAIEGALRAIGEGYGWSAGCYWAREEEGEPLSCRRFWHAADEDPEEFRERTRGVMPQPEDFPRAEDTISTPLSNDRDLLGVMEFFSPQLREEDSELAETLASMGAQTAQFVGRKRAEAEIEKLKDEFFALVSHELRTPLTSIVGYTEMLTKTDGDQLSERGLGFVDVIRRNARREMRLVGDLLVLVRIQAGTFEIEPGTVDVHQVVEQSVENARPMAEKAGLELTLNAEQVKPCAGDSERLAQAFDNLLSNAIKFTPEGGSVRVSLTSDGDKAVFGVTDTGVGIPQEDHSRLFDRLYRASSATEGHVPGTGLGLTIVKAITEAHGGTVGVESAEHQGSTFKIELPIRPLGDSGSQENGASG